MSFFIEGIPGICAQDWLTVSTSGVQNTDLLDPRQVTTTFNLYGTLMGYVCVSCVIIIMVNMMAGTPGKKIWRQLSRRVLSSRSASVSKVGYRVQGFTTGASTLQGP